MRRLWRQFVPLQRDLMSLAVLNFIIYLFILALTGSGYIQISQRKRKFACIRLVLTNWFTVKISDYKNESTEWKIKWLRLLIHAANYLYNMSNIPLKNISKGQRWFDFYNEKFPWLKLSRK